MTNTSDIVYVDVHGERASINARVDRTSEVNGPLRQDSSRALSDGPRNLTVVAALALAITACGQTYLVAMPHATPDVIERARSSATFAIERGSGVEPTCLFSPNGLDTYCVRGIRHELEAGLDTVAGSFLTPAGSSPPAYTARLGPITLREQTGGRYASPSVAIDWDFTLTDANGHVIVRLRDTTVGAHPLGWDLSALQTALEGLEDDVLERIRSALGDSIIAHPASSGS